MNKLLHKNLRTSFNIFGPNFERWLLRMLPIHLGAEGASKFARDFRVTSLNDLQRQVINRLIAMWVEMNAPKLMV